MKREMACVTVCKNQHCATRLLKKKLKTGKNNHMKNIIAFILITGIVACTQQKKKLPYYDTADFTPKWNISANDDHFHKIRPFRLTNQNGQAFTEKNMDGKICVVDFFFTTCPGICPKLTNSM